MGGTTAAEASISVHDHAGEHIGLKRDQYADEAGQRDRVEEDEPQD